MSKNNKKNVYHKVGNSKGKSDSHAPKKQYIDMYYMNSREISVKEIYECLLNDKPELKECVEYWEEAGVLEIMVGEDGSIDMEMLELSEDELADEFLFSNKIICVYSVHTNTELLQELKALFGIVVEKHGGMLCSDTADFQPILVK
ncbi:MAG: hypothetical protein IJW63_00635 [Lachnospiraceae bacterium]|nr:hypothetical protein [Lachnospiraceae bacterium]